MRFWPESPGAGGVHLRGVAAERAGDRAAAFAGIYAEVGAALLRPETLRLQACFWGGGGAPGASGTGRVVFAREEQPGVFEAVYGRLGRPPGEAESLVLMQEGVLARASGRRAVLAVLIQDASSALEESAWLPEGLARDLGWCRAEALRAAVAAVLSRAAEGLPGIGRARGVYREICANAACGLIAARYRRRNGEAIFLRENPGVVALLARCAESARRAPPLPAPVDADEALEAASAILAACSRGGRGPVPRPG